LSMQISLRFIYLLGIFIMLSPTTLVYEIIGLDEEIAGKLSNIIFVVYVLYSFSYQNLIEDRFLKWLYYVLLVALALLSLESYMRYSSFFRYPHVFSKLTDLFAIYFIYLFYKKYGKIGLKDVAYLVFILFLINIFLINRDYLNFRSFAAHERGIPATVVYLLLIPCLYFFNAYLTKEKYLDLFLFLVVLGFIIFFQHRTIWVVTTVLLALNIFFFSKTGKRMNFRLALPFFTVIFVFFIMAYMIVAPNEKVMAQIKRNIEDIRNPTKQGTAGWRFVQYVSYWPYVVDHIALGMRFEGFELPIQFYDEDLDQPVFEEGHGHHFHSFYLDKLFYFGVAGLLFVMSPVIYLLFKALRRKKLNAEELALAIFAFSGFIYALSYDWPGFFFGLTGFAFYALEKKPEDESQAEPETADEEKELAEAEA